MQFQRTAHIIEGRCILSSHMQQINKATSRLLRNYKKNAETFKITLLYNIICLYFFGSQHSHRKRRRVVKTKDTILRRHRILPLLNIKCTGVVLYRQFSSQYVIPCIVPRCYVVQRFSTTHIGDFRDTTARVLVLIRESSQETGGNSVIIRRIVVVVCACYPVALNIFVMRLTTDHLEHAFLRFRAVRLAPRICMGSAPSAVLFQSCAWSPRMSTDHRPTTRV